MPNRDTLQPRTRYKQSKAPSFQRRVLPLLLLAALAICERSIL